MMKQIRKRFIGIALLALTLAMLLVAGAINVVHFIDTSNELNETLNYIVENENANVQKKQDKSAFQQGNDDNSYAQQKREKGNNHHMNTRLEESRYFIAIQNTDGELILGAASKETEYSQEELLKIAEDVLSSNAVSGYTGNYIYRVTDKNDGSRAAIFLK